MHQLTEQQKAFIEAYSQSICECPKNLLIKYFEDSEKFGRTYREYYSNIEDCYSIWLFAINWANKPKESSCFDSMLGNPMQTLNNLSIR
jgi:hypothetical protein